MAASKARQQESVSNAIHEGIKRGIEILLERKCYGSTVILVYAGMDAMAYLNMPDDQEEVSRKDFIVWAERYIRFPCDAQLTGLDLYGARCSMLHNFSAFSQLSRQGKCRMVGYMDKSIPEVVYNPRVSKELVLVSVTGLAKAFFAGVDRTIVELFGDPTRAPLARKRLRKLMHAFPYSADANATV